MSDSASASETIGDRGELHENGFECVGNDEILEATNDAHGGVIVEMKKPMEPQVFLTLLRASLLQWKKQRKEGVWIKLPIELVNLAETAVKEGFWFHHAEPSYVMLVYWIPQTGSTIPPNASHRVSVGAIVLNDKKEVLVVQEKRGIFHGLGVWKIPTGVVDAGEDLFAAAIREVKEETGIDAEFLEVLAFSGWHLRNMLLNLLPRSMSPSNTLMNSVWQSYKRTTMLDSLQDPFLHSSRTTWVFYI